jgi:hypothetical protein
MHKATLYWGTDKTMNPLASGIISLMYVPHHYTCKCFCELMSWVWASYHIPWVSNTQCLYRSDLVVRTWHWHLVCNIWASVQGKALSPTSWMETAFQVHVIYPVITSVPLHFFVRELSVSAHMPIHCSNLLWLKCKAFKCKDHN